MNYNILTIKSQETLQQAFTDAASAGNQAVENGHLLRSLRENAGELLSFVLGKSGVNQNSLWNALDRIIASYPKVEGGEQYLSNAAAKTFTKAEIAAKSMGDEFVSVEHILLGMLAAGDDVAGMLADSGLKIGRAHV